MLLKYSFCKFSESDSLPNWKSASGILSYNVQPFPWVLMLLKSFSENEIRKSAISSVRSALRSLTSLLLYFTSLIHILYSICYFQILPCYKAQHKLICLPIRRLNFVKGMYFSIPITLRLLESNKNNTCLLSYSFMCLAHIRYLMNMYWVNKWVNESISHFGRMCGGLTIVILKGNGNYSCAFGGVSYVDVTVIQWKFLRW